MFVPYGHTGIAFLQSPLRVSGPLRLYIDVQESVDSLPASYQGLVPALLC